MREKDLSKLVTINNQHYLTSLPQHYHNSTSNNRDQQWHFHDNVNFQCGVASVARNERKACKIMLERPTGPGADFGRLFVMLLHHSHLICVFLGKDHGT